MIPIASYHLIYEPMNEYGTVCIVNCARIGIATPVYYIYVAIYTLATYTSLTFVLRENLNIAIYSKWSLQN